MRVEFIEVNGEDGAATLLAVEKRLTPRERGEREAVARLAGEAALLARLGGRFTPRLIGSGDDERGPFLRTAKLASPTLAERLAASGGAPLPPAWIERAARASFAALAELHEASDPDGPLLVVHADLSPANLAIDDAGTSAWLLDLELACWRDGSARDGAFRGTVAYVAPEVARGEAPTPRSDLFALAATLLHAMLGAPPRDGPSLAAVLAMAAEQPLLEAESRALAIAARGVGHAAIVGCLAHEPEERPRSARAVLALLG